MERSGREQVELVESVDPASPTPEIALFSEQPYKRVVRFNRPPTALLLPLVCPLSGLRLRIPVRGNFCQHTQVFNKKSFLALAANDGFAQCPICLRRIRPSELVLDESIFEILALTPPTTLQVRVLSDGSFEPVELYQESSFDEEAPNESGPPLEDLLAGEEAQPATETKPVCRQLFPDSSESEFHLYKNQPNLSVHSLPLTVPALSSDPSLVIHSQG